MTRSWILFVLLFAAVACGKPDVGDELACGANGACPDGYECSPTTNRCVARGGLTPSPDAASPDAAAASPDAAAAASPDAAAASPDAAAASPDAAAASPDAAAASPDAAAAASPDAAPAPDTSAPDTRITEAPPAVSPTRDARIAFAASEPATFECSVDGGDFDRCDSPFDLQGLGAGDHRFAVRARDAAGNVDASPAEVTFTVDLTGPETVISGTPADGALVSVADVSFTFASADGATFTCSRDGGEYRACASPSHFVASGDGEHVFRVRATDLAGRLGPIAQRRFTLDQTAPVVTIAGTPADGALVADRAVNLTLGSDEEATLLCVLDGVPLPACDGGFSDAVSGDGLHSLSVQAIDRAGNAGTPIDWSWTLDTTGPEVSLAGTPRSGAATNDPDVALTLASEPGARFLCAVDGVALGACASPFTTTVSGDRQHVVSVTGVDAAGNDGLPATWSFTLDTQAPDATLAGSPAGGAATADKSVALTVGSSDPGARFMCSRDHAAFEACIGIQSYQVAGDGEHSLAVYATDDAGNQGETETRSWLVDSSIPDVALSGTPHDGTSVNSRAVKMHFSSSDPGSTFQCSQDGGTLADCAADQSYEFPDVQGPHSFLVRAWNAAHTLSADASQSWIYDSIAPAKPAPTGTVLSGAFTNKATIAFSWTPEAGAGYLCKWDSLTEESCSDGSSTHIFSGDGPHSFTVYGLDNAFNKSPSATVTWTLDRVPPTAPVLKSTDVANNGASNQRTVTITWTPYANEIYRCPNLLGNWVVCTTPYDDSAIVEGAVTFSVRAYDRAGNVSAASSWHWTWDKTAPTATITKGPGTTTSVAATIEFKSTEVSRFSCKLDGNPQFCPFNVSSGSWSSSNVGFGAHTFTLTATDAAGNTSDPVSYSWFVRASG